MPPSQDWLTASAWAFSIMTWTLLITWSLLKRLLLLLVRVNEPTAWISNIVVREHPASATSY